MSARFPGFRLLTYAVSRSTLLARPRNEALAPAGLRLGRLAAFSLVLVVLFLVTTEWWATIRRWFGWLVIPLGQNALFAYSAHVFSALAAAIAVQRSNPLVPTHEGENAALQLGVVALVWVLVQLRGLRVLFSTRPVPVAAPTALSIVALAGISDTSPTSGTRFLASMAARTGTTTFRSTSRSPAAPWQARERHYPKLGRVSRTHASSELLRQLAARAHPQTHLQHVVRTTRAPPSTTSARALR